MHEEKDFRTMPWVAIIGSREPSQQQELAVAEAIEDLHHSEVCIISGCADGIDALALLTAHNLGFITIGIVPWTNYNTHVQGFCTHVICIDEFKDYARQEAYASVDKYHPAPDRLSQGARKLHRARGELFRRGGREDRRQQKDEVRPVADGDFRPQVRRQKRRHAPLAVVAREDHDEGLFRVRLPDFVELPQVSFMKRIILGDQSDGLLLFSLRFFHGASIS